jgi:predicted ATPase
MTETTLRISYPAELPVSQRREDIAAAIRDHQVVIVAGETGSGKTTQLPKICLELGRGLGSRRHDAHVARRDEKPDDEQNRDHDADDHDAVHLEGRAFEEDRGRDEVAERRSVEAAFVVVSEPNNGGEGRS